MQCIKEIEQTPKVELIKHIEPYRSKTNRTHQTSTTNGTYRICRANKKHSIGGLIRTGRTNRRQKVAITIKTFGRGETIGTYGTFRTN